MHRLRKECAVNKLEQNVWQQCRDDDYHLAGQSRKGLSGDSRPIP